MMQFSSRVSRFDVALPRKISNAKQTWASRSGLLFVVEAPEWGLRGVGEASPLPGYSPDTLEECEEHLACVGEICVAELGLPEIVAQVAEVPSELPAARFAVETALLDLLAQRSHCSVAQLIGGQPAVTFVKRCGAIFPHDAVSSVRALIARGVHCGKIKVGRCWPEELAAVRLLREVFPRFAIRLDANGGWSLAEARLHLQDLVGLNIQFVEQPVSLEDMAQCVKTSPVAIAADESMHSARARQLLFSEINNAALAAMVLKPTVLGGLLESMQLAKIRSIPAIASHCLEGPIGTAAVAEFAVALNGPFAAGVDRHAAMGSVIPQFAMGDIRGVARHGIDALCSITMAALQEPDTCALIDLDRRQWSYRALAERVGDVVLGAENIHVVDPMRPLETVLVLYASMAAKRPLCLIAADIEDIELAARRRRLLRDTEFRESRELAIVLFSSGSSGSAKGIKLSRQALLASARGSATVTGFGQPKDRWLCCLPLWHVGGLSIVLRSLFARRTAVLSSSAAAVTDMQELAVSHVSLVPTMLWRWVRDGVRVPLQLRAVLMGGASIDEQLVARGRGLGFPLLMSYGMTETASLVICDGVALPDVQTRIVDDCLQIKSPTLMDGYLTPHKQVICDGWLATGDRARIGAAGDIQILGRSDDMIISGGENISPREIESLLVRHPDIDSACALGIAHPEWGQQLVALVVLHPECQRQVDLTAFLHGHQIPKRLIPVASLPLLGNGKVDRQRALDLANASGDI